MANIIFSWTQPTFVHRMATLVVLQCSLFFFYKGVLLAL